MISNDEIVVKPLHSRLRTLAIYSGATILGDGRVALILSAAGLAVASARFGTDAESSPRLATQRVVERTTVLLLRQLNGEPAAVLTGRVRRIVLVYREQFEHLGDGRYVMIDEVPTRLHPLGDAGDIDTMSDRICFVLLPRDGDPTVGYLVSAVLGTEQVDVDDVHSFSADPTGSERPCCEGVSRRWWT